MHCGKIILPAEGWRQSLHLRQRHLVVLILGIAPHHNVHSRLSQCNLNRENRLRIRHSLGARHAAQFEHARHVFHILIANLFRFLVFLEVELASRQIHPRLVQRGQRHLGVIEIRRRVNPKQHSLILRINEIQVRRTNPLMDVSNQFRKLCFVIEFCNPVEHGLQRSEARPVDRRLVSAGRVVIAHLLLDGRAFRRCCSRLLERLTHGSDVPQGKRIECSPPRLVGRNRIRF